jgi:hypothetical protein
MADVLAPADAAAAAAGSRQRKHQTKDELAASLGIALVSHWLLRDDYMSQEITTRAEQVFAAGIAPWQSEGKLFGVVPRKATKNAAPGEPVSMYYEVSGWGARAAVDAGRGREALHFGEGHPPTAPPHIQHPSSLSLPTTHLLRRRTSGWRPAA